MMYIQLNKLLVKYCLKKYNCVSKVIMDATATIINQGCSIESK